MSSNPQSIRYPCVESVMDGALLQAHVHDIYVRVLRQSRSILFRVFFKRHAMLPRDPNLNLQGDIVIMRVASRNKQSVVNMRSSDRHLADDVLRQCASRLALFVSSLINLSLAPTLRRFQGPKRCPLPCEIALGSLH